MKSFAGLLISTGLSVAVGLTDAAAAEVYAGGSAGEVESDVGLGLASSYDASDSAYKLLAGARLLDWLAVEASYVDLGRVTYTGPAVPDASFFYQDQKAIDVFAVFLLGLGKVDLFAKTGLARWDVDGAYDSVAGAVDFSEQGTDFVWGVGVQGSVGEKVALRLEYERLEFENFFDTFGARELLSFGFTWTFR